MNLIKMYYSLCIQCVNRSCKNALIASFWFFSSCNSQNQNAGKLPATSIMELQKKGMESQQKPENFISDFNYASGLNTVDFRYAAKVVTPAVVHIKSTYTPEKLKQVQPRAEDFYHDLPDPFREFFKDDPYFRHFEFKFPDLPQSQYGPRETAGSGIIITNEGYILTNNHVISEADGIEVILNDRRTYTATVVGTDPQTDLALLKINEKELHFVKFGDSDSIEIGEWVVAVGNPFNLSSTVTAGIVSAKARNINILKNQGAIESFIQTDAAVNPGNSGGALVNLKGELVGINTAIATPTGVYAGYAFAIPSNIAKKIVDDLLNYGAVQRGYLGVVIRNLDGKLAKELELDNTTGVYVDSLLAGGAAREGGVKEKDVIIKIDGKAVNSTPELQEAVAKKRPGDRVKITLVRNKNEKELTVTLKGAENTLLAKKETQEILKVLGIEISELSSWEKRKYKIDRGIKIEKVYGGGKIRKFTSIHDGFIITRVNNKSVDSVSEFIKVLEGEKGGGVMIEGKYPDSPLTHYYAFGLK